MLVFREWVPGLLDKKNCFTTMALNDSVPVVNIIWIEGHLEPTIRVSGCLVGCGVSPTLTLSEIEQIAAYCHENNPFEKESSRRNKT